MKPYILLKNIETGEVINTYEKWGLILNSKENTPPTPKTSYVSIPAGDGSIDLTEFAGEVKYNDRTIKYNFSMMNNFKDLPMVISMISNTIHGNKYQIFNWDDLEFYYIGRLSINEFKVDRAKGSFVVEAICEPYKYKKYPTVYEYTISGSKNIVCPNLKKRVVPVITLDSQMTIEFNDTTYVLSEGSHQILNICFDKGIHDLKVTGNGNFKIEYQESSL